MPLDYSKWDNIEDSSVSSDDCHPNIEKASWKRLKKRTREEKGTLKHLQIRDKWNTTSVNNKSDEEMPLTESGIDWMKANEDIIEKFVNTKTEQDAIVMMCKEPRIADHVVEGYLITRTIDEAVALGEGTPLTSKLELVLDRCLLVHNCVLACKSANLKPEISVKMFAARLKDPKAYEEYTKENVKQLAELTDRVYKRRTQRIAEAKLLDAQETPEEEDEKVPVGPGGLHPNEVMATLPQCIADAFVSRDVSKLEEAIKTLPLEDADYHMDRCVKAGLWVPSPGDEGATKAREERIRAREAAKAANLEQGDAKEQSVQK